MGMAFHNFGASSGEIGMMFSVAAVIAVVLSPVSGRIADKFGRLSLVYPGTALMASGCFGLAFADTWTHFVAAYLIWAVGESLTSPAVSAYTADIAPKNQTATAMALTKQAQD